MPNITRIPLSNRLGNWFNLESSTKFFEAQISNGSNLISSATLQQHSHESLFLTKGGKWVLNKFSDYSGNLETYEVISGEEAATWFSKQGLEAPDSLSELVTNMEI